MEGKGVKDKNKLKKLIDIKKKVCKGGLWESKDMQNKEIINPESREGSGDSQARRKAISLPGPIL